MTVQEIITRAEKEVAQLKTKLGWAIPYETKLLLSGVPSEIMHSYDRFVSVNCSSLSDFRAAAIFLPFGKYSPADKAHFPKVNLTISNSHDRKSELTLSYTLENDRSIRIDIDYNLVREALAEYCVQKTRNLVDSEYHYFIGYSTAKLKTVIVPTEEWKNITYEFDNDIHQGVMKYYGGYSRLLNPTQLQGVLTALLGEGHIY